MNLISLAGAEYLDSQAIAQAEALGLKARAIVEGLRAGDHRSPYRGFSVEFVQHREYVPGDDIRHIDWKSYGRSERYTVKQYEQETNLDAHLLLDGSRSLLYGEGPLNKLEYAKLLVASLAWLIIQRRDSAGLSVFDSGWRSRLPPSSNPTQIQAILRALVEARPEAKSNIGAALLGLSGQIRRKGLVFLISDGLDDAERLLAGLRRLRYEGHEVMLWQILHPDELEFPFEGQIRFLGVEEPREVLTRPGLIRAAYLRALRGHQDKLLAGCRAMNCDYVLFSTAQPVGEALSAYLARRLRLGALGRPGL